MENTLIREILRVAGVEPQPRPYAAVIAALERALDKAAAFDGAVRHGLASMSAVDEECTLLAALGRSPPQPSSKSHRESVHPRL